MIEVSGRLQFVVYADGANLMGKNINTWKENTDDTLHEMLNAVGWDGHSM